MNGFCIVCFTYQSHIIDVNFAIKNHSIQQRIRQVYAEQLFGYPMCGIFVLHAHQLEQRNLLYAIYCTNHVNCIKCGSHKQCTGHDGLYLNCHILNMSQQEARCTHCG